MPCADQLVSIIIPVRDKWELTAACLRSIRENTAEGSYEVIVISNGSTDGTVAGLGAEFPWVRAIIRPDPMTFSAANNLAFEHCRTPLILFLNNDTKVTTDWLPPLVGLLLSDPSIAAVGPKLLYPGGLVQHAGVVFNHLRLGYHFGARWRGDHPAVNRVRDFKALTAACLLCRAADFAAAGRFDEAFATGGEDVDLCLKWGGLGKRLVYTPASTVIHIESQSPGRMARASENERLFLSRWHDKIRQDDLDLYAVTRLPAPDRPNVGVIFFAGADAGKNSSVIEAVLRGSECGLAVLIVLPSGDGAQAKELRLHAPLFEVIDAADTGAFDAWVIARQAANGFGGFLTIRETCYLVTRWDHTFLGFTEQRAVLAPLVRQLPGVQGWGRFTANLPGDAVGDMGRMRSLVFGTYHNLTVYTGIPPATVFFLPARLCAGTGTPTLIRDISNRKPGDPPTALVTDCMLWSDRAATADPSSVTRTSVIVACDQGATGPAIRDLCDSVPPEAETILCVDDSEQPADGPFKELLDRGSVIILRSGLFKGNRALAFNRAACLCVSPVLIFADAALQTGDGWTGALCNELAAEEEIAAACAFGDGGDDSIRNALCTAVRRTDFFANEGFAATADHTMSLKGLLARISRKRIKGVRAIRGICSRRAVSRAG